MRDASRGEPAALEGSLLDEVAAAIDEELRQDAVHVVTSQKARTELGWKPEVSIEEGSDEVIAWVEENWDEIQGQPLVHEHKP